MRNSDLQSLLPRRVNILSAIFYRFIGHILTSKFHVDQWIIARDKLVVSA